MATNNVDNVSQNIFYILDEDETPTPYEWDDMPEFVQEDLNEYDEVTIRFRNKEDLEEFAKLIGQPNIVPKKKRKKSTWYPAVDRKANSLRFWVNDEDLE